MVRLKRSKPQEEHKKTRADVELMEDLVRASLAVNPGLRDGKSTSEVMTDFERETIEGPQAPPQELSGQEDDSRQSNIEFFFENKARQWKEKSTEFEARHAAIDKELRNTQDRMIRELVDFLVLSNRDNDEARKSLRGHHKLLQQLEISEQDVLRRCEHRRKNY